MWKRPSCSGNRQPQLSYQISRKQTLANSPGLGLFPNTRSLQGTPDVNHQMRWICGSHGAVSSSRTWSFTCQTSAVAKPKQIARDRNMKWENKISSVKRDRENDDSGGNYVSAGTVLAHSAALSLSPEKLLFSPSCKRCLWWQGNGSGWDLHTWRSHLQDGPSLCPWCKQVT